MKALKITLATFLVLLSISSSATQKFEFKETGELVNIVNDAVKLMQKKGEASFKDLSREGTKWRTKDSYVFIFDREGNMFVHPDPELQGKNKIDLRDVSGRMIIRSMIETVTTLPEKSQGWYHYQWPVPNEIHPRWKSSFIKLVTTRQGKEYIVGSGVYNDHMEKTFITSMVEDAAALIEKKGKDAFADFHNAQGRFLVKDAYIFVIDPNGVELANPAFPNLEGKNVLNIKDSNNKLFVKDFFKVAENKGEGWVNYMWPKPGDSTPTQKSTFVKKVKYGDEWFLVASGAYLADAPKAKRPLTDMTAPKLMKLVREASALLEKNGEAAYTELRKKDSKWFTGDTYFFVWNMDGTRTLHAADPSLEGKNGKNVTDIHGRPYGKMFLEVASSPEGEGWVHYMYPYPNQIFPAWKSAFIKRVTLPDGKQQMIGTASYHMQMDENLVEDLVNRATLLIKQKGRDAFVELRSPIGPFYFMDTYVFVDTPEGLEVVNPAHPYLEGRNILELKDAKGKAIAKDYIVDAMKNGSAWSEYYWYKEGENNPSLKRTFVRKVESSQGTFIVGSGFYAEEKSRMAQEVKAE